jgi:hypothetical protein
VSRVPSKTTGDVCLDCEDSALSALDLASARLGAVRRRGGGCPTDRRSLPGARNGRRLGLNRRPFGGCRLTKLSFIFAGCRGLLKKLPKNVTWHSDCSSDWITLHVGGPKRYRWLRG